MIPEILGRCKTAFLEHQKPLGTIGIIVLSGTLFLGFAKLEWLHSQQEPIRIEQLAMASGPAIEGEDTSKTGPYVASKAGKRYYLTTCSGVKTIKESNKIYFKTKEAAEARGLTPAANCKGL